MCFFLCVHGITTGIKMSYLYVCKTQTADKYSVSMAYLGNTQIKLDF